LMDPDFLSNIDGLAKVLSFVIQVFFTNSNIYMCGILQLVDRTFRWDKGVSHLHHRSPTC
jgi:hypothetical protein